MRLPKLSIVVSLAALFFISFTVKQSAQTKTQFPGPTSYISDLASALDEPTKQRLENLLENLKQKNKIYFYVAVVETTGGQEIFEFSRQLAHDWNVGSRTSEKKSLLLVVAINEKTAFTQFSRSVQGDLPDGVLGDMTLRMRGIIANGRPMDAINWGVETFVGTMARRAGLTLQDFEQPAVASAPASTPQPTTTTQTAVVVPVSDVSAAPTPAVEEVAKSTRSRRINQPPPAASSKPVAKKSAPRKVEPQVTAPVDDADELEEVDLTLTLPFEPRVVKLKEFLEKHPRSKARAHALELLVSAYAALGDQQLKNAQTAAGIASMMQAIDQAPVDTSDKLFAGVISQIPLNLYLRGERADAFKAAQAIETKFGNDPNRLLTVAGFYLGIENGEEAARVAALAVKLAPDMAEAHHALALGLHFSLRLDDAMAEYRKAFELDPKTKGTRRSLADLLRASGRADEAIALYREQISADPTDKAARNGLVLALFDVGLKDEANAELDNALRDDPRNIGLLAGAAYWLAAHGDATRSLELARRAVDIEPRYTWAQIAAARALLASKQPMEAERALRFAKQYGKFPTLDYELATVLASVGLYDEAAEALHTAFVLNDGKIEARLAGRFPVREASFIELLAPERRASIFQFKTADTPENAAMLKSLATFYALVNEAQPNEQAIVEAGKQFAAGDDSMRAYRQLYVSSRLLRKNVGLKTAYELAEAAKSGVDAAMDVPAATTAVQADELREIRARAIAAGGTPNQADAPRAALASIVNGKIEDQMGWALFNEDKAAEALDHLKRATSTIPAGTPAWRTAMWHLGAAFEQTDQKDEALNSYIKSYVAGDPDPVRRQLIEQLYKKINGSLDGLDQRLSGVAPSAVAVSAPAPEAAQPTPEVTPTPAAETTTTAPAPDKTTEAPKPAEESKEPVAQPTPTEAPKTSTDSTTSEAPKPNAQPPVTEEQALAQASARLRSTVKITGRVVDASGKPMASVVVILISPRGSVLTSMTDAEGKYSFNVSPSQRNYRLVPSREGFQFDPVDRAVVAFGEDLKTVDFVANQKQ
jgi:uncharacterized membrane protein YgcG/tetratricopeptide (TPR) repeat protein